MATLRKHLSTLLGLTLAGTPLPAIAGNCGANGNLYYLGNTSNGGNSVWLSATSAGGFRLDSAQQNTTVDQWSRDKRGLHVSLSPFVSTGNGGTHKLYDTTGNKDCLLDTQNQKGGIVLPPHITFPNIKPPGLAVPPIGKLFPGFSTLGPLLPGGMKPPGGGRPGGGVAPITPTLPSVPTLPARVTPPILTLPPDSGQPITPTRPTVPSVPGRVTPPILTLPPDSGQPITPTRPTSPSLPGGVTPPIATIPPGGEPLTPTRPTVPSRPSPPGSGVTPPTGPPPPVTGGIEVVPAVPGTITVPIDGRPPATNRIGQEAIAPDAPQPQCIDPANRGGPSDNPNLPECAPTKPMCPPDTCQALGFDVPITPGRDLGMGTTKDWNLWTDVRVLNTTDGRYGLDIIGAARTATVGLDRKVSSDIVVGFTVSLEDSNSSGYGGFLESKARGITVGPYAAWAMSPNWAIDAAVGYNRSSNDLGLAGMDGNFLSQRLSGAVNLHGQYDLGIVGIRPKLTATYAKTSSDGYSLNASLLGMTFGVDFPGANYDYGTLEGAVEFNHMFTTAGGTRIMPYAEFGSVFEYTRPNGGQMLTADLQIATPSPWAFTLRSGVRMLLTDSILLEANAGYLSFGQNGLNVVEGRVHLSFAF